MTRCGWFGLFRYVGPCRCASSMNKELNPVCLSLGCISFLTHSYQPCNVLLTCNRCELMMLAPATNHDEFEHTRATRGREIFHRKMKPLVQFANIVTSGTDSKSPIPCRSLGLFIRVMMMMKPLPRLRR